MKKINIVLFASLLFASCTSDQYPISADEINGQWQLTEQLMDPGDGSGQFMPVTSDKSITFFQDGTYESNGVTCSMTNGSGVPSSGKFNSEEKTIEAGACGNIQHNFEISYEINNGDLILYYPCIEACAQKFTKIK